ncbi:hypothetical protein K431DRAFT_47554 [Polychaeton citri CBS 116435]|uniref:Uncharacterized protein n=1 Tax=Polychaeton citri CBS 116435 TaxID=1314669 RepID=A0A9P4QCQ1_9PEZI|nr:hypothetical protein K431DRAFT_47554 [Polychaeton citri CBS 116435]
MIANPISFYTCLVLSGVNGSVDIYQFASTGGLEVNIEGYVTVMEGALDRSYVTPLGQSVEQCSIAVVDPNRRQP